MSAIVGIVHRQRRGAELALLVVSAGIGIFAYVSVDLGVNGSVPGDIVSYGGWLIALIAAAHVAVRLLAPYADPVLLPIVALLNGLGLAVIHRLDLAAGPHAHFARTQLVWMTLGVALFIATLVAIRDHRMLQRFTYTSTVGALLLLILPMLPVIGAGVNGARIWVHLGPLSFQPGEVAKVLLVIGFAGYLVLHKDALAVAGRRFLFFEFPRGRDLGPILSIWLVSLLVLVRQNDLGSSLLFFGLFVVMLYVSTGRRGWVVLGAGMFLVGAFAASQLVGHVQTRVAIWLHPLSHYNAPVNDSYQLVEGMFGMAWGGLVGRGLGQGYPWRISYANSDFIIAAIGEELGLAAVMAVLVCYLLIIERSLRTALICRDDFGKLLCVGLGVVFALQTFTVVGGVTDLIPLTGLTTPFLSYGGSSLIANWVIIALVLRVSDQARRPLPDITPDNVSMDDTQVVKLW